MYRLHQNKYNNLLNHQKLNILRLSKLIYYLAHLYILYIKSYINFLYSLFMASDSFEFNHSVRTPLYISGCSDTLSLNIYQAQHAYVSLVKTRTISTIRRTRLSYFTTHATRDQHLESQYIPIIDGITCLLSY